MSNTVRILIGGMGAAALPLVELAESERERLLRDYGFCFSIVRICMGLVCVRSSTFSVK